MKMRRREPAREPGGDGECSSCWFFSSRRRHTRLVSDWSSDVCSSDLRNTRTCSLYFLVSRYSKKLRMAAKTVSCSFSARSQKGTVRRTPLLCAVLRKLPSQDRYLGLVHGSTAPPSRVRVLSGITKSISKSMVLPKPWHRGQAPKGLLKLNRRGSGSTKVRPHCLQANFSLKRRGRQADPPAPPAPPAAGSSTISPASR